MAHFHDHTVISRSPAHHRLIRHVVFYRCHLDPPRTPTQLRFSDKGTEEPATQQARPPPPLPTHVGLGSHPIPIPRSGRVTPGSREEMLRTKGDTKERLKIIIGCKLPNIARPGQRDRRVLSQYVLTRTKDKTFIARVSIAN